MNSGLININKKVEISNQNILENNNKNNNILNLYAIKIRLNELLLKIQKNIFPKENIMEILGVI